MLKKGRSPEPQDEKLTAGKVTRRIIAVIAVTAVIAAAGVCAAAYLVFRGPSNAARNRAVTELRENILLSWIPGVFLSQDEIKEIVGSEEQTESGGPLIIIDQDIPTAGKETDAEELYEETEGLSEEDPDGEEANDILVTPIRQDGFTGYLVTVEDPKSVILGVPEEYGKEAEKADLEEIADRYEAPWAVNAVSYVAEVGAEESGAEPDGCVISEGKLLSGSEEVSAAIVGLDEKGVLHLGTMTAKEAMSAGIGNACVCDSILILNGKEVKNGSTGMTACGPISAIGQREDGTILFLVIDGWQAASLGATREDTSAILQEYGAKNAALLACGAQSGMMLDGEFHSAVPEDSAEAPACAFMVPGE